MEDFDARESVVSWFSQGQSFTLYTHVLLQRQQSLIYSQSLRRGVVGVIQA